MRDLSERTLDDLIARLPTGDVFDIAMKLGVKISLAKWYPVTAGEISHDRMEIVVNERAVLPIERIIAHELGHFIFRREKIDVAEEESFCDLFAERLTELRTADK